MVNKRYLFLITLLSISITFCVGQVPSDSLFRQTSSNKLHVYHQLDSLELAHNEFIKDSLKLVNDSLALVWIKPPPANRPNPFLDSLVNIYKIKNLNFEVWSKSFSKKEIKVLEGKPRVQRERWVLVVIFCLIIFLGLIKNIFAKDLNEIVHLFYTNRSLFKTKEDSLFNSWIFLFLYILFGLTFGIYFYLTGEYIQIPYARSDFQLFLMLSLVMVSSFAGKVIILRIVGFIFDIQKPIKEHIATLYLFFSNSTLIFLPIVVALSLLPHDLAKVYSHISLVLLISIFVFQCFRAFFRILFGYQLSIIYLFIYLCVLEVCPLIILIKVFKF